jgi:hypothetical protein
MAPEPNIEIRDENPHSSPGKVVGGIIIIVVGLALLGDTAGFSDVHLSSHLWPAILIVLGVMKLADSERRRGGRRPSMRSGLWLIYLGCWGFVNELHLFGLDYHTSWPLLVVGAGFFIVWRGLGRAERTSGAVGER